MPSVNAPEIDEDL
ncbi:hypothetical protein A2U01_0050298, partial [Trifolium medium]|nr:hypothetical protein [Trifolium medium]